MQMLMKLADTPSTFLFSVLVILNNHPKHQNIGQVQ